jgi:hypothetical protein
MKITNVDDAIINQHEEGNDDDNSMKDCYKDNDDVASLDDESIILPN